MKKIGFCLFFLVFAITSLFSLNTEQALRKAIDTLAEEYVNKAGTVYSKITVTLSEIENISPLAREHYIGQVLRSMLKSTIDDSLVFKYVDREHLEQALKELELSVSVITEYSEDIEIGKIENVTFFIAGDVIEEGDYFVLTLELIEIETTTLLGTAKARIPKTDLIELGDEYAFTYLAANGIGISIDLTPHHILCFTQDPFTALGDGSVLGLSGGAKLTYRLTRYFKFAFSFNILAGDFMFDDRKYQDIQNVPDPDAPDTLNLWGEDGIEGGPAGSEIDNLDIYYRASQYVYNLSIPFYFVYPVTHKFNISAGAGPSLNIILLSQVYDSIPARFEGGVRLQRYIADMWLLGLGIQGSIDLEYFVLPRLAVNGGISGVINWMLTKDDPYASSPSNGEAYYGVDDVSIEYFGLNPFYYPDGRFILDNLLSVNYMKLYLGVSLYF